jgi:hypothetical protein
MKGYLKGCAKVYDLGSKIVVVLSLSFEESRWVGRASGFLKVPTFLHAEDVSLATCVMRPPELHSAIVTDVISFIGAFRAAHMMCCLKALPYILRLYLVLEKMSARNVSYSLPAATVRNLSITTTQAKHYNVTLRRVRVTTVAVEKQ